MLMALSVLMKMAVRRPAVVEFAWIADGIAAMTRTANPIMMNPGLGIAPRSRDVIRFINEAVQGD